MARSAFLLAFVAIVLSTAAAIPSGQVLQADLFPISSKDSSILPSEQTFRGVDDVGVALTNATAAAIEKARNILEKYSDVLRIVAIPSGLAVTFFGYFLLGPVLFLAAFISGGGACFVAVNTVIGDETPAAAWISIAAMLLGGALLGFFAMRALNFGMFAVGGALGVVLASALKTSLIAKAYPKDPQMAFIIAAVVCGLVFGLLAMCLQKQMLIFSTAYAGSCACMFGIGHFAGHFPTTKDLSAVEAGRINGWLVLYFALTLLLGTAGMFFQFWLGRGKPMPEHAPHDRRRRRRRVRQYDYNDLSDDDDWADDVYVERVPLPRRKREPSRVRSNPSVEYVERGYKGEHEMPPQTTFSQNSWNSVKNAGAAFDGVSSMDEGLPAAQVANTVVQDVAIAESVTLDLGAERIPKESSAPVEHGTTRAVKPIGTAPELFDLSDTQEPADIVQEHSDDVQQSLEHVPLESDAENLSVKVEG